MPLKSKLPVLACDLTATDDRGSADSDLEGGPDGGEAQGSQTKRSFSDAGFSWEEEVSAASFSSSRRVGRPSGCSTGSHGWEKQRRTACAPGPSSAQELFEWPLSYAETIVERPEWLPRLRAALEHGIEISTDYSGCDFIRESLHMISQGIQAFFPDKLPEKPLFVFTRSCDNDPIPQKVLIQMATVLDGSKSCVFSDIMDRIPAEVMSFFSEEFQMSKKTTKEQAAERYEQMLEWLLDPQNAKKAFPVTATSPCLVHGGRCLVRHKPRTPHTDFMLSSERLIMNFGSTICKGWSSMGKQARFAHESEGVHNIWLAERKEFALCSGEDMFFSENTRAYPVIQKLRKPLAKSHIVLFIKVGPQHLGRPIARTRCFSVGLSRSKFVWLGPAEDKDIQADFNNAFGRSMEVDGDYFFLAGDEVVEEEFQQRARARKVPMEAGYWKQGLEMNLPLLPPGMANRFSKWAELQEKHAGPTGAYLGDLDQWPNVKTGCGGPLWPVLLTHGHIASFSRNRIATGDEHLLAQGVVMFDGITDSFSSLLRPFLQPLSRKDKIFLAGNGLCAATWGAWFLYVMSNLRRIPEPVVQYPLSESSQVAAEDEVDEDFIGAPPVGQASG